MEKNDIILIHGTNYKQMAKKVMEAANVAEDIGDKKKKIALKPNLVTAKAPSSGATTHSELLAGVIEYLQEHGFENITIMEGSWVGDRTGEAFRAAGYDMVCDRYHVPFVDLQRDTWKEYDAAGMKAVAGIPSREVLLSKLLGSFKSPIASFARVIKQIAEKDA